MKDANFYAKRYLRRRVSKVFDVTIGGIIYIDKDVILTETQKKQIQKLKELHQYTEQPARQIKMFDITDFTDIKEGEKVKRKREKRSSTPSVLNEQTLHFE
jgi:virulence-associated protein VapD